MFTKSYIAIYSVVDDLRVCGRLCVYMQGAVDDAVRVCFFFFNKSKLADRKQMNVRLYKLN